MNEYVITVIATGLVYFFLILAIVIVGKKELTQLSVVDLVFILLISNAVQNAMVDGDWKDFIMGLLAAVTLFILNFVMKTLQYQSPAFRKFLGGVPTTLIENGVELPKNLRKEEITEEELMSAIREHGVEKVDDVKLAVLETDGNISVISFDHSKKTIVSRRKVKVPVRLDRKQ